MPESKSKDSLSFTFSDDDHVLALTRITDDGSLFTRRADHWVPVTDNDRGVYDRTMRDISPEHYKDALSQFDADPAGLTKDDILAFLAAV
jgi:hypothetical protein